jgi:hypothetical protein
MRLSFVFFIEMIFLMALTGCVSRSSYPDVSFYANANFDQAKSDLNLLDSEGRSYRLLAASQKEFAVLTVFQFDEKNINEAEFSWLKQLVRLSQDRDLKDFDFQFISVKSIENRGQLLNLEKGTEAQRHFLSDVTQYSAQDFGLTHNLDSVLVHRRSRKIIKRLNISSSHDFKFQILKAGDTKTLTTQNSNDKAVTSRLNFQDQSADASRLDYAKEIAPIFIRNCVMCHREGGLGSWSMKSYDSIVRWKKMIREVILTKRMPPAQTDLYYQKYSNEIRPSVEEIKKIIDWIDIGAPNKSSLDPIKMLKHPPKPEFVLGKPDLVISLPIQSIGAADNEFVKVFKLKWPVEEVVRIRGMDVQTDNIPATHHVSSYYLVPKLEKESENEVASFDAGYIPGYEPAFLPYGASYAVPAKADIRVSPHLIPTGKDEKVNLRLAYYFDKSNEHNELINCGVGTKKIDIAPFEQDYEKVVRAQLKQDIRVIQVGTHMHSRGRFIRYTAELPDKTKIVLLSLPNYTRNWQREYIMQNPIFLPKGTILNCEAHYDNSINNPLVQNPEKRVTYGWLSDNEMLSCSCYGLRDIEQQKAHELTNPSTLPYDINSYEDVIEILKD